jgi:hypothetical protein
MTSLRVPLCAIASIVGITAAMPAAADPISLINASFEAAWTGTGDPGYPLFEGGYAASPTGPGMGWTFDTRPIGTATSGAAGVTMSNTLWGYTAYDGQQFAWFQDGDPANPFASSGGNLQQSFTLSSAGSVDLVFELARRTAYSSGSPARVAVAVDGQIITTVITPNATWTQETVALGVLGAGAHTLGFGGAMAFQTEDTSAFVDSVALTLAPVPEPSSAALAAAGLLALGWTWRRRRSAHRT